MKVISGQHHVSAMTGDAKKNLRFYTEILGMRLVKKTVNQDDPSMYHLFYADETGTPGTDLTFFELPFLGQTYRGSTSLSCRRRERDTLEQRSSANGPRYLRSRIQ